MGYLCHIWRKCQSTNGFALSAPNEPRFLRLDNRSNPRVFSHDDSHLARNLKDCNLVINDAAQFAPSLLILSLRN